MNKIAARAKKQNKNKQKNQTLNDSPTYIMGQFESKLTGMLRMCVSTKIAKKVLF